MDKDYDLLSRYCNYLKDLLAQNSIHFIDDFEKWSRPYRQMGKDEAGKEDEKAF